MPNYTKNDLQKMLAEVQNELGDLLKAVPPDQDGEDDGAPASTPDQSAPEGSASSSNDSAPPSAPPAAEGSADGAGSPEASGAPPAMGAADGAGDPAAQPGMDGGGQAADPAALEAEYEKLPPEVLKAHLMACRAAAMKVLGGGMGAGPEAGPESSGAPAAAPSPSPAPEMGAGGPPPMAKDIDHSIHQKDPGASDHGINGTDNGAMAGKHPMAGSNTVSRQVTEKSEKDYAALQMQLDQLTKAVEIIAGTPIRKAVTSVDYVPRGESPKAESKLSKAEVTAKLSDVTRNPELKKSDRELINAYYDGKVKLDKIEHLLNSKE